MDASKHKIYVGSDSTAVYGMYFDPGMGYNNNRTTGVPTGDNPETIYAVMTGKRFGNLGIQFPMSLSTDGDARAPTLQLSWGRGDRDTFLSVLRADWLCARMVVLERG